MRARFAARGLPAEVFASWRASLAERPGAVPRILAWARADDGYVVGSPAVLSVGTGISDAGDGGPGEWRHVGWHEIEHGGWNAESRSLSWTLYGGRRGRIGLAAPGRLPELFRERVAASIVVERFVPLRGEERGATVTARRDLGGAGSVTWHSTLTRGLSWSDDVTEQVARASAELQSEYGTSSPGW